VLKLLSEDPGNYPDAPREGIRRILEEVTGRPHPRTQPLDTSRIASIRMGTTVATNALLERKGGSPNQARGERSVLLVSAGFKDLLYIGNQSRPNIFDLEIRCPDQLYEAVVEVDEAVVLPLGDTPSTRNGAAAQHNSRLYPQAGLHAVGVTGEAVCVRRPPDLQALELQLQAVRQRGITSCAVVLKHAALYPAHELLVGQLASRLGFTQQGLPLPPPLPPMCLPPPPLGRLQVSLSHQVMPMVKMVARGFTAAADAYLTPHIMRYLTTFQAGFDSGLSNVQVLFMQSDGGLCPASSFSGHKAVLSGPAGGVVGYALTTQWEGQAAGGMQVIGFDMGGTSTDVSRYAGSYELVFETTTAGVTIQAPQLDVNTVAAGGGSRLFFRDGLFCCGPDSVGAHPGPACYKKGGAAAITDANLVLGRIVPDFFPKAAATPAAAAAAQAALPLGPGYRDQIFGPQEDEPLDAVGARAALQALTDQVNAHAAAHGKAAKSLDEVAAGFLAVANEAMCRPIRALTQMKGYDASAHVLACFGGAGGQHACSIARALGMKTIFIHKFAGILSAVGIQLAQRVSEAQEPVACQLSPEGQAGPLLEERLTRLEAQAVAELQGQVGRGGAGVEEAGQAVPAPSCQRFLHLRYQGTDVAVMTARPPDGDYGAAFRQAYQREFGFTLDRAVLVDDVRVRAVSSGPAPHIQTAPPHPPGPLPAPCSTQSCYWEQCGRTPTPCYLLGDLDPGHKVAGPALLLDAISTLVVEPGWTAVLTADRDVRIDLAPGRWWAGPASEGGQGKPTAAKPVFHGEGALSTQQQQQQQSRAPAAVVDHKEEVGSAAASPSPGSQQEEGQVCGAGGAEGAGSGPDPIQLAIFSHRFMGIAEQMGRTLQRTSISVNIKERLDFSCALFGPEGGLVANAPHLPVHLGAMSEAVRFQVRYYSPGGPGAAEGLQPGDVLASNHPQLAGGSHLPDITVITPVFQEGRIVFFVASRGHHADIGGISPGSMPPASKLLVEEGAAIVSFKLVRQGVFQARRQLQAMGTPRQQQGMRREALWGAVWGALTRLASCLPGQVAANTRGIQLVGDLIQEYGLDTVTAYMHHIQAAAEAAVREMLREFSRSQGLAELGTVRAADTMDDGSPICLAITIDRSDGSAVFDFEGTGHEVYANHNAPPAVAYSAIIYALRCLVKRDIPLNQGCLAPITIRIPPACLLNPSPEAAVVGGNVLTSQRVTDVVLRAFQAAAASQGCMNNLTFGDEQMGYYETIAGGAGAGPGWHGRSGVHTHMTNTRITDPEILERRYPVVLRRFELRSGSGGGGQWKGGDGVVRELEALRPISAGILSERRATAPFGLLGGGPGAPGLNLMHKAASGRTLNIGGKASVLLEAGDRLSIFTPGAGGYGADSSPAAREDAAKPPARQDADTQADARKLLRGSFYEYQARQEGA
ncbi:hypothetical protein QJQ45_024077, partial [Haematococcus lacustris]